MYATLALALLVCAGGAAAYTTLRFGGTLGVIGFVILAPWLLSTPASPATLRKRRALLGGAAFCQGVRSERAARPLLLLLLPLLPATNQRPRLPAHPHPTLRAAQAWRWAPWWTPP